MHVWWRAEGLHVGIALFVVSGLVQQRPALTLQLRLATTIHVSSKHIVDGRQDSIKPRLTSSLCQEKRE